MPVNIFTLSVIAAPALETPPFSPALSHRRHVSAKASSQPQDL